MLFGVNRSWRILLRLARWLACLAVIISPWLFGSAEPWEFILIAIIVTSASFFWLLSFILNAERTIIPHWAPMAFGSMIIVFLLQLAPLGSHYLSAFSPESQKIYDSHNRTMQALNITGQFVERNSPRSIASVSGAETMTAMLLFMTYFAVFFILANSIRSKAQLRKISYIIVISGFIIALISIIHKFTGSDKLLWLRIPPFGGYIFGPFTNRNHYALYMNMTFSVGLGLLLYETLGRRMYLDPDWRVRLSILSTRYASRIALLVFMLVVISGSVCMSLSRGGFASIIMAISVVYLLSVMGTGITQRKTVIALLAIMILAGGAALTGPGPLFERTKNLLNDANDPINNCRLRTVMDTTRMARDFPLLGTGFGTFERIFPLYQTCIPEYRFRHAHNDWVQLLAEGGIIGAGVFIMTAVGFLRWIVRHYKSTYSFSCKGYVKGIAIGILAVSIQSATEYGLHKPANAMMLAAMCGLAVACFSVWSTDEITSFYSSESAITIKTIHSSFRSAMASLIACSIPVLIFFELEKIRGEVAAARIINAGKACQSLQSTRYFENAANNLINDMILSRDFQAVSTVATLDATMAAVNYARNMNLKNGTRAGVSLQILYQSVYGIQKAPTDHLAWYYLAYALHINDYWDNGELALKRSADLKPAANPPQLLYNTSHAGTM
jgi:O-antigen ligase